MNILYWFLFVFSMMSLIYCLIIVLYAGIGITFWDFWFTCGVAGIFISFTLKYLCNQNIKLAEWIMYPTLILFLIAACILTLIELIILTFSRQRTERGMDYMIVLGARVKGEILSKILLQRMITAVTYLQKNPGTNVIVSGGKGDGENLSEAEAMKRYLINQGIADNRIIKEDQSSNTYENFLFSKQLLNENATVAVVTNGFHMFRATRIAKKQGLVRVHGLAAPTDKVLALNYYVREAVGVMKDMLQGNL